MERSSSPNALRGHLLLLTGLLATLAFAMPATAQSLPFLDEITTRGMSPYGYRLDSYRWNKKDGLPDRNLFALLQDRNGLMWMSSKSGLFTFDGHTFRTLDVVNKSLDKDIIVRLAEDLHGNIWLVKYQPGSYSVDVLNPLTREIMPLHQYIGEKDHFRIPENGSHIAIYNIKGKIWLGTDEIGFHYDGHWREIFRHARGKQYGIWRPSRGGIWRIDKNNVVRLLDSAGAVSDSFTLAKGIVLTAWIEADLSLWLGCSRNGTAAEDYYLLSVQGEKIVSRQSKTPPASDWHSDCSTVVESKKTGYWLYPSLNNNTIYLGFLSNPRLFNLSRLHPYIGIMNPLYFDREGGIWTTTDDGIIRLVLRPNLPFQRLLQGEMPPHSTRGMAFTQNRLLINSYKGARQLDLTTGRISSFDYTYNDLGLALLVEGQDFWVAEHRLALLQVKANGGQHWYEFENQPDFVYSIWRTDTGQLLAATDRGLFRLNDASRILESTALRNLIVSCFFQNKNGLWAGTSQGLFLLDNQGNILRQAFLPTPGQKFGCITHIHEDEAGIFWMATHGGGLLRWNPANGETKQFTIENGLSNDLVHAVYPDRSGHLWLPSDFGLMRFHKNSGRVQTFFEADGLADSEFNLLSHIQMPDGRLFLGGIDGITAFYPDSIPPEQLRNGKLQLIDARTFNLRTGLYSSQSVDLTSEKELVLRPSDAYLDLSVSGLQYERSDLFRFAWKIQGVQDNWIEQESPLIRLSNLPYGSHRLLVRYSRYGNQWSEKILEIPIRVVRPFYLDWPFLLLLLLAITGLAWLFSLLRSRRLRQINLRLEEEVLRRTQQIDADREVIRRQAEELRSLDEMKSRFFANVTHELRTPLTLILSPVDRLLRNFSRDEKTAETLRTIQKSAMRLLNLVEELMELSRMEAGKLRLDEKPLAFRPFLSRLLSAFQPYAEHRGVKLRLLFEAPANLTLLLDERKWEKVVNNLLGNAVKFTSRGGSITLSVREISDHQLLLQVEDTGQGIASEDLPFIFDRYYQSRAGNPALQGGAGIGLALCREYARLFNGELTVESTFGKGSIFRLVFPYLQVDEAFQDLIASPSLEQEATEAATAPLLPRRNHTILVVEDDKDMLAYIQNALMTEYNVLVADNGLAALEQLEKQPVDLVLSDVMMPEMDGFRLLEQIKARQADLPVILLTALVEMPERLQALRLGVDDYMTKPFAEEELLARLRNLIHHYQVRRRIRLENVQYGVETAEETGEASAMFDKKWLAELEEVVKENLGDADFSVQMMADAMHLSVRTLQNRLKTYVGMSPNQYLTEARLLQARQLLEERVYKTTAEVCYAVGMKTPHYFAGLMKERFGKSPTEY
jgi:signal transduction histidine kinase/ligand-binding sensor domain-containing protein/DNA-binding NarL/FixJ family response regulator